MNKIKQILIGASILALSGNAAAFMIGDSEYPEFESLVPVILGVLNGDIANDANSNQQRRLGKNLRKYERGTGLLETGGLNDNRQVRVANRVARKEAKLIKLMSRLDLAGATSTSNIEGGGEGGDENGDTDVPEPSTIALLGLGLVGIGVARRLRKKAH